MITRRNMIIKQSILDSKTCRSMVGGLAALFMMTVAMGVAHADWTPWSQVARVWQYVNGNGYVDLKDFACPGSAQTYFVVPVPDPQHAILMEMLTKAYSHDTSLFIRTPYVRIDYTFVNSLCQIRSLQFYTQIIYNP